MKLWNKTICTIKHVRRTFLRKSIVFKIFEKALNISYSWIDAFHPQILKPTRITYHSATLIDNIFFNSLEHHAISGNIVCGITDHLPNFFIITKLSNPPKMFKMYKRDYSRLDNEALISEVSNVDWAEFLNIASGVSDVNTVFQNFYLCISDVINKYAPLRKLTRKEIKCMCS